MDPRSTLLQPPPNVLETPSLIDESRSSYTWGETAVELHGSNPDYRDCTELVSESQIVTGGGVVRDVFLSDSVPSSPVVSRVSSPSLDDESGYHTTISRNWPGPRAIDDGFLRNLLPYRIPTAALGMQGPGPILMSDRKFICPRCPRTFKEFVKTRYSLTQDV